MAVISTSKLRKSFGKVVAVEGLDLDIEEGEVFGLLGPNGAGKTTTIKMLATLLTPTSGSATVNGFDVSKSPSKVRESIGIVFQEPSSDELLSGYENLKMHSMIYGIDDGRDRKIDEALELVELSGRKNDPVKQYSGGMRRRLEIARSLLHKPKVLFLDEPTLGLDPRGRENMWGYVERLVEELNMTILLTTHYMEEADELADRICIIDHGQAVATDTPAKLKMKIGGDLVTITPSPSTNADAIKKLEFVKSVEKTDGKLLITVVNGGANLQELLKKAGKIENVEVRSPTLGDVFIKFTGRGIEQAEGGWFDKIMQQSVNKQ